MNRTRPGTVAAALGGVHVLLALLVFDPAPYGGGDNAVYFSLGKSLVERHAYLDLFRPDTPPHTQYPPAFPALLALGMAVGLRSWIALKLLLIAVSAAAVAGSYLLCSRMARRPVALATGVFLAVSPGILFWTHTVLSDIPFWALTVIALAAFERRGQVDRGLLIVGIAATVLAYFTRTAGLPLVLAVGVWLAFRDRKGLALFLIVFLPLAFAWWRWGSVYGGGYMDQLWLRNPYDRSEGLIGFADLPARFAENTRRLALQRLPLLLSGASSLAMAILGLGIVALAIPRWVQRLRHPRVSDLFLPLYVGLLLVWPPIWADDRFLLPLLPLLLVHAGQMLYVHSRSMAPTTRRAVRIAPLVFILLLGAPALARGIGVGIPCTRLHLSGQRYSCLDPNWQDFYRLAEASRTALPPNAVVISRKPELFYTLSGRRGVTYPFSSSPDSLFRRIEHFGATHVVIDQLSTLSDQYLLPAISGHPTRFCVRRDLSHPTALLLEILPDPSRPRPPGIPASGDHVMLVACAANPGATPSAPRPPPASPRR